MPPLRKGTPSRRASAAITKSMSAGSGVPKVGAPDCIEIEEAKDPNTTGAPGLTSWQNAIPARASARVWVAVPATVTGRHRPGQDERSQEAGLVVLGVHLGRAEHVVVPAHRAVGVAQREQDGVLGDEVLAEEDLHHVDRVLGPLGGGDRSHERDDRGI